MTLFRRLLPRAADQHGLLTPTDALAEGGTRMALVMLARRGTLERITHGIYRVPELAGDRLEQYQEALLRFPAGVLSHDTALDLHDLCDINPAKVHITVPARLRIRGEVPAWLTIHRDTFAENEVTWLDGLAIVTPARAIVDGIAAALGDRFVDQAIAAARERNLLTTREEQRVELARTMQRARHLQNALAT